jgi:hypothetical protein
LNINFFFDTQLDLFEDGYFIGPEFEDEFRPFKTGIDLSNGGQIYHSNILNKCDYNAYITELVSRICPNDWDSITNPFIPETSYLVSWNDVACENTLNDLRLKFHVIFVAGSIKEVNSFLIYKFERLDCIFPNFISDYFFPPEGFVFNLETMNRTRLLVESNVNKLGLWVLPVKTNTLFNQCT